MKRYALVLAIALLSTFAASALETYRLKIRGSLISPSGRTRIRETDLVVSNGNWLVFDVDLAAKSLDLFEMSPTTGQTELGADNVVVGTDGKTVIFDMQDVNGFSDNLAGLPAFTDRLMANGRVTARSLRFSVIGVWDASTETFFKGVITGKRVSP
jgi:hypothetical protein